MVNAHRNALPEGFELEGYRFEGLLGVGGFGITYLATELNLGRSVAIKEYLPSGSAARDQGAASVRPLSEEDLSLYEYGLSSFADEARMLVNFHHPNVVAVHRFFEANGTAYLVMRYIEGRSYHTLLERKKKQTEAEITAILLPLLDGLEHVHAAGVLHRDIKPGNIFIQHDGVPVLLDFGAARHAIGERSLSLTSVVTPGYSPLEQYSTRARQGPWTDIYALGATLYRAATGAKPPAAPDRGGDDPYRPASDALKKDFTPAFRNAIDAALARELENRPQAVADWRQLFEGTVTLPLRNRPTSRTNRQAVRRWAYAASGVVLMGAAAAGGYWALLDRPGRTARWAASGAAARSAKEVPETLWERTDGGKEDERAQAVASGADGTVRAAGRSGGIGYQPGHWALALSPKGEIAWRKTAKAVFGSHVVTIVALDDGGFVGAGQTIDTRRPGHDDPWIFHVDSRGETVLNRRVPSPRTAHASAVAVIPGGGYILAGSVLAAGRSRDGLVVRLDGKGAVQWRRTIGGAGLEGFNAVLVHGNGDILLAGYNASQSATPNSWRGWVVRMDASGRTLWERTFGGLGRSWLGHIAALPGGGYLAVGNIADPGRDNAADAWILRLAPDGAKLWERRYGGGERDYAARARPLGDGGAIVVGATKSKGAGKNDAWILRLDRDGLRLWDLTLGGKANDVATDVVPMADGGFAVVGATASKGKGGWDAWIVRLGYR